MRPAEKHTQAASHPAARRMHFCTSEAPQYPEMSKDKDTERRKRQAFGSIRMAEAKQNTSKEGKEHKTATHTIKDKRLQTAKQSHARLLSSRKHCCSQGCFNMSSAVGWE